MNDNQNPNVNNVYMSTTANQTNQLASQDAAVNKSVQTSNQVQPAQVSSPVKQVAVQPVVESVKQDSNPAVQASNTAAQVNANNQSQVIQTPSSAQVVAQPVGMSVNQENQTTTQTQSSNEEFFTPVSVQPQISSSVPLPETTSNIEVKEEKPSQEQPQQSEENVEVIETVKKSRAGNVILIIFLILLIAFVYNIDTVITMYDQYMNQGVIVNPKENTNNLTDGYILIDDSTSSIKVKDIKFYNFKKSLGKGITFNYEALANYNDSKTLNIYLELYNSDKEIIYKELFDTNQKLEKDTVRTYVISTSDEIFNDSFYSLIKVYTDDEKQKTSSLTCTLEDDKYSYEYIFDFKNNGLVSYYIEKTSKNDDDESLTKEYEELKESNSATFDNNTLKYKVDLNDENDNIVVLFDKDTTLKVVKDTQIKKEWICE